MLKQARGTLILPNQGLCWHIPSLVSILLFYPLPTRGRAEEDRVVNIRFIGVLDNTSSPLLRLRSPFLFLHHARTTGCWMMLYMWVSGKSKGKNGTLFKGAYLKKQCMNISRTLNPSENYRQVCEKVNRHGGNSSVAVRIGISACFLLFFCQLFSCHDCLRNFRN